jgi:deoxyribodipyrimidine photo-lyase
MAILLQRQFDDRQALINYVAQLSNQSMKNESATIIGGLSAAETALAQLNLTAYSHNRNHLSGAVSRLSPYLRHGIISAHHLAMFIRQKVSDETAIRFIQQLAWRQFFQHIHQQSPDLIWKSKEAYKTGFHEQDYASHLPKDIEQGTTGVKIIDQMSSQLKTTGYLHNHCRLYLASYVVHWRRVQWQAGAQWFLNHLLDGDIVSNNYSWQWVASTFSSKPYVFNLDNVRQFSSNLLDTEHPSNRLFDTSYEDIHLDLFPNMPEKTS